MIKQFLAVFAFLGLTVFFPPYANSETVTIDLLNPVFLPQEQGWSVMSTVIGPLDLSTNGIFITSNTIGAAAPDHFPDAAVQWFHREIPIRVENGFSIQFSLKVNDVQAPHNLFDAGIVFYGSTIDPSRNFTGDPKDQFVFFDKDLIGWGDESQTFAMDTTDNFHLYRLTVDSFGLAQMFVNNELALEKRNFIAIPRVGFGDITNDTGLNGSFSIASVTIIGTLAATTITIDIKPGSFPNSINPRSREKIPVAILTTGTFDATTVDPTTVLFGQTGTEAAPVYTALEDVDGDGDTDMILHFNTHETGIMCGDISASLTGETFSGQTIEGSDAVNTVGCK